MKSTFSKRGKVGIITLPSQFNYGNRLQNYAVHSIYQGLGLEAASLVIEDRPNFERALRSAYYRLRGTAGSPEPGDLMSEKRIEAYRRFNSNMPMRQIGRWPKAIVDEYDYFSTGSDQVWNPSYMAYNEGWYLLEFCRADQRIALAASIGVDEVKPKSGRRIAHAVELFRGLSVREKRAAEIISEYGGRKADVVCDPTLVIPSGEWRSVANAGLVPKGPYVFTYLLGGIGSEAADVLDGVTKHGLVPVVPLSDRQKPGEPDAGPAEFIDLIDNAAHVVTDSFHAAVFSSILQTPLTIVHREGGASMFSRLEGLADMLGIEHKIYGSDAYDLSRAGDYDGVPEAIGRERAKFMAYLEGCLDAQLPGWRDEALA